MKSFTSIGVNIAVAAGSAYLAFEFLDKRMENAESLYDKSLIGIEQCVEVGKLDYSACAEGASISSSGTLEAIGVVAFIGVAAIALGRAGKIAYFSNKHIQENVTESKPGFEIEFK